MNPVVSHIPVLEPNICLPALRLQARKRASSLMENYSGPIRHAISQMTSRLGAMDGTPRAGELLPILLQEVSDVEDQTAATLGGAWFSLYLYTMFADAQMDEGYSASPIEIMASAALLNTGLSELRKHVTNTAYEGDFENSIQQAISAQADDFAMSRAAQPDDARARTSVQKNMYLVSLAIAYGAKSSNGDLIIEFVRKLLLAVQYLDDVTDYADDFISGNYTVLLARSSSSSTLQVTEDNLLEQLVVSGALATTLDETHTALSQALLSVANRLPVDRPAPILTYLSLLLREIDSVQSLVKTQMESLMAGLKYSSGMKGDLQERLRRIAFSS